jgi:hypothetical protein
MMFVPGCACCGCRWTFHVRSCNGNDAAGATVLLEQSGVTIATGTTDSMGSVTLDVPAGSYDVTVTPDLDSGHRDYTATLSHTCGQTTTVDLVNDSGHVCNTGCCDAAPFTLTLTFTSDPDGHAGATLAWSGTGLGWLDTSEHTVAGARFRYFFLCSSESGTGLFQERWNEAFGEWQFFGPVGTGSFNPLHCYPFIQEGSVGANPPPAKWTVMG